MTVASQRTRKPFPIKKLSGVAYASQFFDISDSLNVRTEKDKRSDVHDAIFDTITNRPHQLLELNAGMTFVAKGVKLDKDSKTAIFTDLGLINGSQTRWMLKEAFEETGIDVFTNVQFIVTEDEDYIKDISIALNFQNRVQELSILGALGALNDLNNIFLTKYKKPIRRSETDSGVDFFDTDKIIQVALVMMPDDIAANNGYKGTAFKSAPVSFYSSKARCRKFYKDIFDKSHPKEGTAKQSDVDFFNFFNLFAAETWRIYEMLIKHQPEGRQRQSIFDGIKLYQDANLLNKKTKNPAYREVVLGYALPVLYSMREYIESNKNKKGDITIKIDTESFLYPKSKKGRAKARDYINRFRDLAAEQLNDPDEFAKKNGNWSGLGEISLKLLSAERSEPASDDDEDAA